MFVTPLYAGVLALWFVILSVRVVNLRRRGMSFGDNGEIGVIRIVRAQANFAEYVPLALLLMGFLEVNHYSIYLLHALGVMLVVARLFHGFALSWIENALRACRRRCVDIHRAADRGRALFVSGTRRPVALDAVNPRRGRKHSRVRWLQKSVDCTSRVVDAKGVRSCRIKPLPTCPRRRRTSTTSIRRKPS
jgi:uncharacterized protein